MTDLYLNALGIANALGNNRQTISHGLFEGRITGLIRERLTTTSAEVPVGRVTNLASLPTPWQDFDCRDHQLAYLAFEQIQAECNRHINRYGPHRVGVVLGSSTSGIDWAERVFRDWQVSGNPPHGRHYQKRQEMGSLAVFVARLAGCSGPAYTLSTACSSSAKTFASARGLIEMGLCDMVICGGVDALSGITLNGFESLASMSRGRSNPMSRHRDGLNIGEAAALFVLSKQPATIQLFGVGESCDAYHMSAPHPEGTGAEQAMRMALDDAGLQPTDIAYVNLHGTGTSLNDAMEARAMARVFDQVPCSSTKPMTGHTLGAAGGIEIGFCWLALEQRDAKGSCPLPPHIWDGMEDSAFPKPNLVTLGMRSPSRKGTTYMMSNSFAFGGNNCAVIIGRHL